MVSLVLARDSRFSPSTFILEIILADSTLHPWNQDKIIRGETLNDSCFRSFKTTHKATLILIFCMSGALKINVICPWVHFHFGPAHSYQWAKNEFNLVSIFFFLAYNYAQVLLKPFRQRRGSGHKNLVCYCSKRRFRRWLALCDSARALTSPYR